MLSGGPGDFFPGDLEHDQSWSNFVDCPLLLSKADKLPVSGDEEVWWFVYKPAFEARWTADLASDIPARKQAAQSILDSGSASYVDHLEKKAGERGWKLRWLA